MTNIALIKSNQCYLNMLPDTARVLGLSDITRRYDMGFKLCLQSNESTYT